MDLEFRAIVDSELDAFRRVDSYAFGFKSKDEKREAARRFLELDRTIAAFEGDQIVGTAAVLSWELTVPGPAVARAGAVTWVSVLPTHRRRGLLTAMMGRLLDDCRGRGEPLAALLASESIIYGRFGYGLATSSVNFAIDRRHTALSVPVEVPGRFVLVDGDEARRVIPAVFDRVRRGRPGEVGRSSGYWDNAFDDPEDERDGLSGQFHVVHERTPGDYDGYATYRYRENWEGTADHMLSVREVAAADPTTELALLAWCCDLDLVSRIELPYSKPDLPFRYALADPRRLKVTAASDLLWVRVLDVPAALSARTYSTEGGVVLGLDDAFLPENSGRYELVGGPEGAECRPTQDAAELSLSAADLGAAYLGGTRLQTLAAAGRVREEQTGALERANAMFAIDPPPYCDTDF